MTNKKFYRLFRAKQIPIYFHWSAALMFAAFLVATPILGLPFLFIAIGLFIIQLIHEFGHAFLATRMGYEVEKIEIFPLLGLCYYEHPYSEYEDAVIAWGGVAGQLLLFLPAMLILSVFGNTSFGLANVLLVTFSYINACIMILNLVPSRGLDGAKAWRAVPILVKAKWNAYKLKRRGYKLTRKKFLK